MLVSLLSLLVLAAVALATFGVGRALLRGLRLDCDDGLDVATWSFLLGLLGIGHAIVALASLGWLYAEALWSATILAAAWGVVELLAAWSNHRGRSRVLRRRLVAAAGTASDLDARRRSTWLIALAGAVAAVLLLGSLAPPMSVDAVGRLEWPKRWLLEGLLVRPAGEAAEWLLPQAWLAWGLALGGGEGARLIGWMLALWMAAAGAVFASPLLGPRGGLAAGGLLLVSPGVLQHTIALSPLVPALALLMLAAAAWWKTAVEDRGGCWPLAAGLCAGVCVGSPVASGLLLVALLGLAYRSMRRGETHTGDGLARSLAVALAAACGMAAIDAAGRGAGRMVFGLGVPEAVSSWTIGGLSIAIVALLPGLLFARPLRGLTPTLVAAGAYALVMAPLLTRPAVHLPLAAPLAVAAVWAWMESRRLVRGPGVVLAAALSIGAAATLALPLVELRAALPVGCGLDDRDAYRAAGAGEWRAAEAVNRVLSPASHLLSQADCTFYFDRRVTSAAALEQSAAESGTPLDARQLSAQLRTAGFSHVLIVDRPSQENRLAQLIDAQLACRPDAFLTFTEYEYVDRDGSTCRYRLLKLQ